MFKDTINYLMEICQDSFLMEIFIAVAIFLFFLVLRKLFTKVIFGFFRKFANKSSFILDKYIFNSFEKPLRFLFVIVGIYIPLSIVVHKLENQLILDKLFRSFLIYIFAWGFYNITSSSSEFFKKIFVKYDLENDRILFPFISKVLRIIIVFLSVSIIIQEWGYNVEGFIAGLGLGGLAFALAAQDTIANVFGGLVIITEKPFGLDDWIETPSVEGSVEDISFRSTKVRTFAHAMVTIPNATLAKEAITNWSRMGKRRITFNLGIMNSTPVLKIENCIIKIKKLLKEDDEIHKQTIFVTFDKFDNGNLNIFVYFFTKTTVWGEYLRVREKINFGIMRILEEEEVKVAFPSTSVYFENEMIQRDENGEFKKKN